MTYIDCSGRRSSAGGTRRARGACGHDLGAPGAAAAAALLALALIGPAAAQDEPPRGALAVGTVLAEPLAAAAADQAEQPLECEMICSPFDPRQAIAQVSWPEEVARVLPGADGQAVDLGTLRLEIVGGAGSFASGDFGAVRLSAVPVVDAQPGVGIDVQDTRLAVQPAPFQTVRDNRVLERDPNLPPPAELMTERVPGALENLSATEEAAMERDAQTGGIGRMRVVAQAVEQRRSVPVRTLVVEGMQPGLTYQLRLVQDTQGSAASLAQNICRVPVCPADFVNQ